MRLATRSTPLDESRTAVAHFEEYHAMVKTFDRNVKEGFMHFKCVNISWPEAGVTWADLHEFSSALIYWKKQKIEQWQNWYVSHITPNPHIWFQHYIFWYICFRIYLHTLTFRHKISINVKSYFIAEIICSHYMYTGVSQNLCVASTLWWVALSPTWPLSRPWICRLYTRSNKSILKSTAYVIVFHRNTKNAKYTRIRMYNNMILRLWP